MSNSQEKIGHLVETFRRNLDAYKASYNETMVRREFIDPFFAALGWDVTNTAGYAEAYKEVVHEDAIKIGGATKAPDYAFRIGGVRKFFVEAKKPSVDIKEDIHPAYQLRRYAWSAKLPLSILTDFEEFAVYDCRIKPAKTDKAATARILYMTFEEYLDRWEEIESVFSREAILKGSFDRYVESTRRKRGTAEVDKAFLKEIEMWRELLARNIALRNPELNQREMNFAVARTIDRIIFLRICEDRGIEDYGQLMSLQNGTNVYRRLVAIYRRADEKYNSGLFHFHLEKNRAELPDEMTLKLNIDDNVLKEIFRKLYYPESPYEFSVLPADILGHIYEQFLGKVIRLTPGHRAKVEEKPEVRKAGGVYYTPTYIVDYIVKNTVGKLLEGKTPRRVSRLKILDPACGSGSFLIGAYQYLLDWHLDWYMKNDPEKWARRKSPAIYQVKSGQWRLTTTKRKEILLNNIYGVDIDPQAVEVTKLSLLLKVLEGETNETINRQLKFFHERALPDLGNNIKCGNSLIGPDFYDNQQISLLDEEERYRINVFDWETEFPEIMKKGGFDAVIGNPPYVRQEMLSKLKNYFHQHYQVYHGTADLYVYFIERGVTLLKAGGKFGYIVANKWLRANYGQPLRRWLKQQRIEKIIDFGDQPVFQKASTYPCILFLSRDGARSKFSVAQVRTLDFRDLGEYVAQHRYPVKQAHLEDNGWALVGEEVNHLLEKIKSKGIPLGKYVDGKIYYGIKTGLNKAFVIDETTRQRLIKEDPRSAEIIKPFLAGRDIKRYRPPIAAKYLIFTRRGIKIDDFPAIKEYLTRFKQELMPRPKSWKGNHWPGRKPGSYQWYEIQDTIDYYKEFEKPKIIIPCIIKKASFTFDILKIYSNDKTSIIVSDDLYLLGLLNSRVLDFIMFQISSTKQGGYFEYKPMYIKQLPIRPVDLSDPTDKSHHDKMVALVDRMLALNKQLAKTKAPHDREVLQRQIDATDKQIDRLVYELYDLTEEEIGIVGGK